MSTYSALFTLILYWLLNSIQGEDKEYSTVINNLDTTHMLHLGQVNFLYIGNQMCLSP